MISYVKQPNSYGCMVASVAMVVGRSYEQIERECAAACFRKPECPGIGEIEAFELLHRYGFAIQRRFRFDPVTQTERPVWPCDPWAPIHIAQVHATQGPHAVVMLQDGKVLDPFDESRKSLRDPLYTHLDWIAGIWRVLQ